MIRVDATNIPAKDSTTLLNDINIEVPNIKVMYFLMDCMFFLNRLSSVFLNRKHCVDKVYSETILPKDWPLMFLNLVYTLAILDYRFHFLSSRVLLWKINVPIHHYYLIIIAFDCTYLSSPKQKKWILSERKSESEVG